MKFLICGMGSIGVRHFQNLKRLGFNDIILYSTGKSTFPGIQEIIQGVPIFDTLAAALDQSPDVCMVTNPTACHTEIALQAAQRGCHLYIEKPLSHSMEGLDQLNRIIEQNKLISFVTYQFRFHPHIRLLRDLMQDQSKYGKAVWARAEWSEYLPDWHPWEDYKQGYSARADLGGGVLLTQIHPLNYLGYIFGELEQLSVMTQSTGTLGIDVDDVADLQVRFNSQVNATVHVDYLQKPRVHTLTIVTDKGRFGWDCHANSLYFLYHDGDKTFFPNPGFERNDMFVEMLRHFIDCVQSNKQSEFTVGQATDELASLLNQSVDKSITTE